MNEKLLKTRVYKERALQIEHATEHAQIFSLTCSAEYAQVSTLLSILWMCSRKINFFQR
jgi:hypothetical protein